QDEESWLNEGLAHLAEDLHGYGWSNLDYRVSAFLNAPERYPLVVADYYRAGLWRSPGIRGGCYLFVRWCADHAGPELTARLTRTNLTGVANLEVATGERFEELFRGWSAALLLGGTGLTDDGGAGLRRTLGERFLCGPRFEELTLAQGEQTVELHGTSAAYWLLHSPRGNRCRLEVVGPADAELQVTLVRLPADAGRLSLRCEPADGGGRLRVQAHDRAMTLTGAAWGRLAPSGPQEPAAAAAARDWFAAVELAAGQETQSRPLKVDNSGPVVFKVSAVDAAGRRLAAWAVLAEGRTGQGAD